jgi:DNA-binding beta-propeller fold protein YncE
VGSFPQDFAFDGVDLLVANQTSSDAMRLRHVTRNVQKVDPTGDFPAGIVFAGASIWIANSESDTVSKITHTPQ